MESCAVELSQSPLAVLITLHTAWNEVSVSNSSRSDFACDLVVSEGCDAPYGSPGARAGPDECVQSALLSLRRAHGRWRVLGCAGQRQAVIVNAEAGVPVGVRAFALAFSHRVFGSPLHPFRRTSPYHAVLIACAPWTDCHSAG